MWLKPMPKLPHSPQSIRWRLLSQIGVVFALGTVALYWAASSYGRLAADSSYDRVLAGSATSIAETLSITPDEVRVDIPYAAMDMLASAPDDRVFYRVIDTKGSTITGYQDLPNGDLSTGQRSFAEPIRYFDADYRGELVRFVLLGREARSFGQTGWVWVQVGQTRRAREALAQDLTVKAILPIAFMTLAALLVIWISVGRALRPLERIGESLAARNPSDLSAIQLDAPLEIAPVITAMNSFMGRLDTNMGLLRTFIATAAHQLRTPLTALLVQIRSAQTMRGSGKVLQIEAAERSARKLARLLDQLLSDALVGHRAEARHLAEFDLKKAVEQAIRETALVSQDSDIRFTAAMPEAKLLGDEVMLAEAIKNLVHNALVHGYGTDGEVQITLGEAETGYLLKVADRGSGIDEADTSELTSRFHSGRRDGQGAGLGLAIVKQVVEQHKGKLTLGNRPGGGTEAVVWLPAR